MEQSRHIPNRLRKYRRMKGFSQKKVARYLGIRNSNRIALWERGEHMPSARHLIRLSVLYGAGFHELYPELVEESTQKLTALITKHQEK